MRCKKNCALSMVALMAASAMMSSTAMAQDNVIAIPYEQEAAWDELAMTNDDAVETGIFIRSAAKEESEVIGYMYQGGAAWVINRGDEWTEIYSGGLTGFVKNEYLTFGSEVTGLAAHYGTEGVSTTWNDVKLYKQGDGASEVLNSLDSGESFILTNDEGHWLQVQNGADNVAYVSEDDVSRVLLLSTAVSKDAVYNGPRITYSDTTGETVPTATASAETVSDNVAAETYEETYTAEENSAEYSEEVTYLETVEEYYEEPSYDTASTEAYYEETSQDTYEESYEESYEEVPSAETYTDEMVYTEQAAETVETTASSSQYGEGIGWFDEYTNTWYDVNGNVIYTGTTTLGYYDVYTGTCYDVYGNPISESGSSTTTYETEAPVVETEAYVEQTEAYVEETEATVSASTDETSLLAAIIYCEAGNQSYEGMVAVGAVVMNRVYSASFPNSISDVIYQSGQFTPAYSGGLSSALSSGVPSACYSAAVDALNGSDPTGGALYFNTGSGKGMKIGAHQFY